MEPVSVYKKLSPSDQSYVPFNAHKQYTYLDFEVSSSAYTTGSEKGHAAYIAQWTSESVSLYTSASSVYGGDTKNILKYYQLDHLYYKDYKRKYDVRFGEFNYLKNKRQLYDKVSILSIPAGNYGHAIKKGSFIFSASYESPGTSSKAIIIDDSQGNLIISGTTDISSSNYNADIRNNILNIGPTDGFRNYDLTTYSGYATVDGYKIQGDHWRRGQKNPQHTVETRFDSFDHIDYFDESYYHNPLKYEAVTFHSRSLFEGAIFPSIGFHGGTDTSALRSSIKLGNSEKYHFNPGDDFTISFWAHVLPRGGTKVEGDGHSQMLRQYIICKSTTKTISAPITTENSTEVNTTVSGALQPTDIDAEPQYPFEVFVDDDSTSTPCIFFSRSDSKIITTISGAFITGSGMNHYTCRVSGSNMEMFINAERIPDINNAEDETRGVTQNNANVYIGSKGHKTNIKDTLSGSLSQINIYDKALTNRQILNHYSSSNNSPYVGNIFYSQGIVALTHPKLQLSGNLHINTLKYKGSHLLYEHEYQCTIESDEFNSTTNLSARKTRQRDSQELADFATSSIFKPYVTTIGLYDENRELLVVGKLGQPICMSDETDTTFVLRWDT